MTGGHGRPVLLAAAGLHMVTQSALAPFYPALFRAAYGVEALAATGLFLVACQVSAVVALPLWGRACRRVPLARLVTAGQTAAVLLTAALVLAPSYAVFTGVSVLLVAAKAVVLLAYPGLARSHPRGVLPGVVQYVAVLHAASVAATLLGGLVVSVPDPRTALPLLAVVEAVLLVACVRLLRPVAGPAGAAGPAAPAGGDVWRLAGYVLLTAVAVYAARPYFTEYVTDAGASAGTATLLFVLPHLAVLALLPVAGRLRARLGGRPLLRYGMLVAAAGLAAQAAVTDPGWLAAARLVFGAGLALGQVALDERVIRASGSGAAYSVVAMGQTAGLLLAPMVATAAATAALWAPLPVCGALLCVLAVAAPGRGRSAAAAAAVSPAAVASAVTPPARVTPPAAVPSAAGGQAPPGAERVGTAPPAPPVPAAETAPAVLPQQRRAPGPTAPAPGPATGAAAGAATGAAAWARPEGGPPAATPPPAGRPVLPLAAAPLPPAPTTPMSQPPPTVQAPAAAPGVPPGAVPGTGSAAPPGSVPAVRP
ncbi:MFS transporter [Streptomyces kanasensis]|uniref:MFS transporter n=1 Tax=Streptomyces kanasensis TaxID=936756 RepID=UPI0036FCAD38